MTSHVAVSAFNHCRAMVRHDDVAADLAIVAARRGGRSLSAVLGHARHQSLGHVARHPPPPVEMGPDAGPAEVAWALACTRPALELAIVDLSGRYGLSRAGLGKALRLAPSLAAARVAAIDQAWADELDPALLAWLGGGECEELATVLEARPRSGAEDLLALSGDVSAHTAACAACADRQRAMTPVRLLVTGAPLVPPPPTVVAAVSGSRLQPPVPPPAIERRRSRLSLRTLATTTAVLAAVGLVTAAVENRREDGGGASLRALTKLPLAAGSLQLVPPTLVLPAGEVSLANASGRPVAWEARADAPWLTVTPGRGELAPGAEQVLRIQGSPPEGDVMASVKVSGEDGSAAAAAVSGRVERPPDLQASAERCVVTAVVEDESDVVAVLHWRDNGEEHSAAMSLADTVARATLPAASGPRTWWVSAVDGRGNQARTPDITLPGGC